MPNRRRQSRLNSDEDLSATMATETRGNPSEVEMGSVDLLIQALRRSGVSTHRDTFKAPTFMGEGDVELFLRQFDDVAAANGWTEGQQTLHLRAQLSGPAQSCGRGLTKAEIVEDLRARFGLTARQAKDRLAHLKRGARQSLHDLCSDITRLVGLGFPTLPRADQDTMAMDYFLRAVDSKALQRHMLAIRPETPREAVVAAEEFFGYNTLDYTSSRAMPVDTEGTTADQLDYIPSRAKPVDIKGTTTPAEDHLQKTLVSFSNILQSQSTLLTKLLQSLGDGRSNLREAPSNFRKVECFECGGPHYKRSCPNVRSQQRTFGGPNNNGVGSSQAKSRQGNANGPAQV